MSKKASVSAHFYPRASFVFYAKVNKRWHIKAPSPKNALCQHERTDYFLFLGRPTIHQNREKTGKILLSFSCAVDTAASRRTVRFASKFEPKPKWGTIVPGFWVTGLKGEGVVDAVLWGTHKEVKIVNEQGKGHNKNGV